MAGDAVDPWGYTENTQVQHNKSQEWYYLKDQMPHELLVFKNADSCSEGSRVFPGMSKGCNLFLSSCRKQNTKLTSK